MIYYLSLAIKYIIWRIFSEVYSLKYIPWYIFFLPGALFFALKYILWNTFSEMYLLKCVLCIIMLQRQTHIMLADVLSLLNKLHLLRQNKKRDFNPQPGFPKIVMWHSWLRGDYNLGIFKGGQFHICISSFIRNHIQPNSHIFW